MCELRAVSSEGGGRRHKLRWRRRVAAKPCSFVLWVCRVSVGDRIAVDVSLAVVVAAVGGGIVW